MIELKHLNGKKQVSCEVSVKEETKIVFGRGQSVFVSPEQYAKLLNNFSGGTVNIGTSRTDP